MPFSAIVRECKSGLERPGIDGEPHATAIVWLDRFFAWKDDLRVGTAIVRAGEGNLLRKVDVERMTPGYAGPTDEVRLVAMDSLGDLKVLKIAVGSPIWLDVG